VIFLSQTESTPKHFLGRGGGEHLVTAQNKN
jgi:hypothetical protein